MNTRKWLRSIVPAIAQVWMAVPIVAGFVVAALPAHAASIPSPAVTGPVAAPDLPGAPTHNYPFFASNHELAAHGYVEQEFFYSGTANRYNTPTEATGSLIDGNHSYATRMIVRRPADPKQFNGTVLVEWLNVTNGFDADNAWFFSWEHILGAGYAWVGVSAQQIGVNALKTWSPSRYGTLDVTQGGAITDDSLSYDIFTQAGQAIRHPTGVDPLGGLKRQTILAIGESQSAGRLATYVNSINPLTPEYDGFFLLSTGGTLIRPDLKAPVFKFLTEYDVENSEATTRQPDTSKFHTWEVAGASHVDKHLRASRQPLELRDFSTSTTASSSEAILQPQCAVPSIGTSVPTHYVVSEAYDLLVRWATKGTPPPSAPRIQITSFGATGQPSVVARNSLGLALGGIQLAELSVPTAKNVGVSSGPGACVRWGYSTPFSLDLLNQLYPNHDRYVDKVIDATRSNVRNQYISAANGRRTVVDALISDVGGADQGRDNDQDFIDWSRDPDFK